MDTYQKVSGIPPERKHVRIKINPDNTIGIKFRSPVNSQFIIGQIKDISFGGIAVELAGTFPEDSIAVGLEIKSLQFILEGREIFIDGIVVAYQKKFCAFLFEGMNKEIREIISQYIFERVSIMGDEKKA
jgi:c-di-GMP-binding flagellar brake protein YcgR